MFFNLLLAHFLADYPLTPDWVAQNKTRPGVLLLHGAMHFLVLAVITFPASLSIWPYLLLLAAVHIFIDASKNWANLHVKRLAIPVYLVDQGVHWGVIGLVAAWIDLIYRGPQPFLTQRAAIYALGFLLVTYVWLITERVIARAAKHQANSPTSAGGDERIGLNSPSPVPSNREKQDLQRQALPESATREWGRLAIRAALLGVILLGRMMLPMVLASGTALHFPYPANRQGFYAFCVDVSVSVCVGVMVIAAQRFVR